MMNKSTHFKLAFAATALLSMSMVQAANMTSAEHSAAKDRISADYKADKAACASLAGNAKDICVEEAKGKEKVAKAELEYGYSGKPADQNKVLMAKAEAAYDIAKEKCDDKGGNEKDVCVKEAKAAQAKAKADAKLGKEVTAARTDAAQTKMDADYKVAAEKCESLAGDAKSGCIAAAKARFGKS